MRNRHRSCVGVICWLVLVTFSFLMDGSYQMTHRVLRGRADCPLQTSPCLLTSAFVARPPWSSSVFLRKSSSQI